MHRERELLLRLSTHVTVLLAVLVTLGFSQIRLADMKLPQLVGPASTANLSQVSDALFSPTASESESYLRRAVVPRTALAARPAPSVAVGPAVASSSRAVVPGADFIAAGQDDLLSGNRRERVDSPKRAPTDMNELVRAYTIKSGDALSTIAEQFDLSLDALLLANPHLNYNVNALILVGDQLAIPPSDGVLHYVKIGDTLESIAAKYKVEVEAIVKLVANKVKSDDDLFPEQRLFIPNGEVELPKRQNTLANVLQPRQNTTTTTNNNTSAAARTTTTNNNNTAARTTTTNNQQASVQAPVVGTGALGTPVFGYLITQYFWAYHNGVDLAAPIGTPVYAADAGRVIWSGWDNTGYGYMLLVDHGNGIRTRYAHLSWIFPVYGEYVNKGQMIGRVGSTGRSSGPHLHFEIIVGGIARNPFNYIR